MPEARGGEAQRRVEGEASRIPVLQRGSVEEDLPGQPLPLEFQAHKTPEGWKIYDISIEGVSLVLTYRSEFDAVVKQGGIDALVKRLREKNTPVKTG